MNRVHDLPDVHGRRGGPAARPGRLGAAILVPVITAAIGAADTAGAGDPIPLKEAKLIIEHNATDLDTGFQGFIDSEGWQVIEVEGPAGVVLRLEGKGELGDLGLTELFFESVEPENADTPLAELLEDIPAGKYTFKGKAWIDGESMGQTLGTAWLSHDIPQGPALLTPEPGATVALADLQMSWDPVRESIEGSPIEIVGYQLIVERVGGPSTNMIGKWGLSMVLPGTVTTMTIPAAFLTPATSYEWEVLAIATNGNQTLSSRSFQTK